MQLREYLSILRRAWPILLLLPLIAGGLSLALALRQPPTYQASARMIVTRDPLVAQAPLPNLDDGSTWGTTEFLLDDLPFIVRSSVFADDVAAAMAAEGYQLDPAAIQGNVAVDVTHRAVFLTANAATPDAALALARGAIATIESGGLKYWGRATGGGLTVSVIDPPLAAGRLSGLRDVVEQVGLRTALALAAAIGLAFLLNALDDRLRSRSQAEEWTGARVIGVIPKD